FGFGGGLVPGVDLYAYLTHPPAEAWGLAWLERGTMQARFSQPVYEGDAIRIVPVEHERAGDGERVHLELRNSADAVCARGVATLPSAPVALPSVDAWPDVPQAESPPPASPSSLVVGRQFGLDRHGFHAARA